MQAIAPSAILVGLMLLCAALVRGEERRAAIVSSAALSCAWAYSAAFWFETISPKWIWYRWSGQWINSTYDGEWWAAADLIALSVILRFTDAASRWWGAPLVSLILLNLAMHFVRYLSAMTQAEYLATLALILEAQVALFVVAGGGPHVVAFGSRLGRRTRRPLLRASR